MAEIACWQNGAVAHPQGRAGVREIGSGPTPGWTPGSGGTYQERPKVRSRGPGRDGLEQGSQEPSRGSNPTRPRMAFRARARILVLCLVAGIDTSCTPRRQVWFTPNIGSPDMLDLFVRPEKWELARSQVDVFKFYSEQLTGAAECAVCGKNTLENLTRVQAIPKLRAWRLALAAEVPVVKPGACDIAASVTLAGQLIENVAARGGVVAFLAMDEPFASSATCGYTPADAAQQVALFIQQVQEAHPGLVIGDIEPYPLFGVDDLRGFLEGLEANGAPPGFFHLDVDHRLTDARGIDVGPDMQALQAYCESQSFPFGVLLSGKDEVDDGGYYEDVIAWTRTVGSAVGMPENVVVQSFSRSTTGLFVIPTNLPEDDASLPTHTRLLNDAVEVLKSR